MFYPMIEPYHSPVQSFTREDALHFSMSDPAVLHAVLSHVVSSEKVPMSLMYSSRAVHEGS